ncbi:MAG: metallophosphoesterase [Kiritimatiellae bacterium]|nr:metallophosphoesterase [Kiritimatiellia bacterium]
MTRRDWIKASLCAGAAFPLRLSADDPVNLRMRVPNLPLPVPATRQKGTYSVLILGDTHFDQSPETVYHAAYPGSDVSASLEATQRAEFVRNGEMWANRIPRLLAAAASARQSDTAFAIQVGDLIQGDCNNATVHAQMANDAFTAIKTSLGGNLPLRLVVGNHDIRNGANNSVASDYRTWMNGRMTTETGQSVSSTNFSYMQGHDLWIHVDFTSPSLSMIRSALTAHADARYKFLVTHGPVIPSDCGSYNWILYGRSEHTNRRALRTLLLQHDVIVIAGHIHTTELEEVVTDEGRITQIIANSVWTREALATISPTCTIPSNYGALQTTVEGRNYLAEYRPAIVRYIRSKAAGFFRLEVSDRGVLAHFFGGDSSIPMDTWRLR